MQPRLFIRADASPSIGTGHVLRMLALAQAWRRRTAALPTFLCRALPPAVAQRLAAAGCPVHLLADEPDDPGCAVATAAALAPGVAAGAPTWLVADGYHFGAPFQAAVRATGARLAIVDDNAENGPYDCDLVVNQNLHAEAAAYAARTATTRLLLGSRFALVREEFLRLRDREVIPPPQAKRVLVTMGGADADNVTGRVLEALQARDVALRVLVGAASPHAAALAERVRPPTGLLRDVQDMAPHLEWAELVVTAAGSTCWELCLAGLPFVAIETADNQRALKRALVAAGAAQDGGTASALRAADLAAGVTSLCGDVAARRALTAAARAVVDGWGSDRVAAELAAPGDLFFRPAAAADAALLWTWANEPAVRAASFRSDPIPWESHLRWFSARRADTGTRMLIAEQAGEPLGVVRFESTHDGFTISVAVAAAARGRGWGARIIAGSTAEVAAATGARRINAFIKPANVASLRAFERAGYREAEPAVVAGQPALQRRWERS